MPDAQYLFAENLRRSAASPKSAGPKQIVFGERELKYFRKMFDLYDTDHSGSIGFIEMKNMCRHLGVEVTDEELHESIAAIDENGNEELEFDEFVHWLSDVSTGANRSGSSEGGFGADPWAMLKATIRAKGAQPLTNKQIEEFRKVFDHFDADGSGTIDTDEIRVMFESMGQGEITDEQIEDLMAHVDDDRSGEIDFDEFLMLMCTGFGKAGDGLTSEVDSVEEVLLAAFRRYDTTGSGMISTIDFAELVRGLTKGQMSETEVSELVALVSAQRGDGFVKYNDWEELWEACHN